MPNSDFKAIELTPEDQTRYTELLEQHKSTWSHDFPVEDREKRSQFMLNSPLMRVFALEDSNGKLVMSVAARRWQAQPVYTITDFKSLGPIPLRRFKNSFEALLTKMFESLEQEGRFEFWYLIEDKTIYTSRRDQNRRNVMQYVIPHLQNYTLFDEVRIKAGTTPQWPLYLSILSNRAANVPTVIRRAIHKNKIGSNLPIF